MAAKKRSAKKEESEKRAPELLEALLDAHVRHELARCKGTAFKKMVAEETAAVFAKMGDVKFSDILTPEQVMGLIRRIVIGFTPAGGVPEIAGEMAGKVITSPLNQKTTLDDIFPQEIYDQFAEKAAGLDNVRRNLVHRAVHNTAYTRMVCDAIFTVVKEYILFENVLSRKIPGLGLFLNIGRGTARMAAPGLLAAVEESLRDFIEKRLETILAGSESFLLSFLSQERMMEISDEAWKEASRKTLASHFGALAPGDLDEFIVVGYEFWLNFRETPYFDGIVEELVHFFFEKYGEREVDLLIEDIGVTPEMVVQEITELGALVLKKALSTGFLEERLRAHLAPFYRSEKALEILAAHTGA